MASIVVPPGGAPDLPQEKMLKDLFSKADNRGFPIVQVPGIASRVNPEIISKRLKVPINESSDSARHGPFDPSPAVLVPKVLFYDFPSALRSQARMLRKINKGLHKVQNIVDRVEEPWIFEVVAMQKQGCGQAPPSFPNVEASSCLSPQAFRHTRGAA